MTEIAGGGEDYHVEVPQIKTREGIIKGKIQKITRRVMQFVRGSRAGKNELQEQRVKSPKRSKEDEDKRIVERKRRIDKDEGCAVRSVLSAAVFASGEKNIKVDQEEWDIGYRYKPTLAELEARSKQVAKGEKPQDKINKDLVKLYKKYASRNTDLGNTLKRVTITLQEKEEKHEAIIRRLQSGEQIMVITKDYSHIFHAGLDRRGRIIALSDPKILDESTGKKTHETVDLSPNDTFTIFTVTPNEKARKPITQNQQALAA